MADPAVRPLLLVEDDADLRDSLAQLLHEEGYRVVQARNGREALDLLAGIRPFVILLDLMMPEMDGEEFLAALTRGEAAEAGGAIPVVVLTAAAPERRLAPDVREVLRKPIQFDRLLPLLHTIHQETC